MASSVSCDINFFSSFSKPFYVTELNSTVFWGPRWTDAIFENIWYAKIAKIKEYFASDLTRTLISKNIAKTSDIIKLFKAYISLFP